MIKGQVFRGGFNMKKRLLSLALVGVMTATLFAGCGSSSSSDSSSSGEASGAAETSAEGGSVYYLNFKPEQDEQWQSLAASYTEQTGVEVTVVTAASGEYETTLASEMEIGRAHV